MKWLLIFPLALYSLYLFCHKQTAGFQVTKIISTLSSNSKWDLPAPDTQTRELLNQPYYYLDKGGQSYAFLSQDGKTVLKLFKMHNLRQYPWGYKMALPGYLDQFRLKALFQQKAKLNRLFDSSTLAYKELQEETGLLYLNLNPNPALKNLVLTLVDKLGISHSLSVETIPFALQQKVTGAVSSLRSCIKNQEITQAKEIIKQMLTCIKQRQEKGIVDIDPAFKRNIGLLEDRAILMDIGAFFPASEPIDKKAFLKDIRPLKRWLKKHSQELGDYIEELITLETASKEDPLPQPCSPQISKKTD